MRKLPVMIGISGVKNSGKTTLIEKLIPQLTKKGYKVAVIKHDGHEFEADVPGTDSFRAMSAGAYGTAVFSGGKYLVVKQTPSASEGELAKNFPEADVILLEGFKYSTYPKIEIVRNGNSEKPVCDLAYLLAIATDIPELTVSGVECISLRDTELIADKIEAYMKQSVEVEHTGTGFSMVVLAGGMSSRMGRDKSDLLLGEKTFLQHQVEKGRALGISDIMVSGYRGTNCNVRIVKDRYVQCGPLGGLEACFRQVAHDRVLVLCVDAPLVPVEALKGLMEKSEACGKRPVILKHGERYEPLISIWPRSVADVMLAEIQQGKGRVFSVLDEVGYDIYETDLPDELFRNVNDPIEYEALGIDNR